MSDLPRLQRLAALGDRDAQLALNRLAQRRGHANTWGPAFLCRDPLFHAAALGFERLIHVLQHPDFLDPSTLDDHWQAIFSARWHALSLGAALNDALAAPAPAHLITLAEAHEDLLAHLRDHGLDHRRHAHWLPILADRFSQLARSLQHAQHSCGQSETDTLNTLADQHAHVCQLLTNLLHDHPPNLRWLTQHLPIDAWRHLVLYRTGSHWYDWDHPTTAAYDTPHDAIHALLTMSLTFTAYYFNHQQLIAYDRHGTQLAAWSSRAVLKAWLAAFQRLRPAVAATAQYHADQGALPHALFDIDGHAAIADATIEALFQ